MCRQRHSELFLPRDIFVDDKNDVYVSFPAFAQIWAEQRAVHHRKFQIFQKLSEEVQKRQPAQILVNTIIRSIMELVLERYHNEAAWQVIMDRVENDKFTNTDLPWKLIHKEPYFLFIAFVKVHEYMTTLHLASSKNVMLSLTEADVVAAEFLRMTVDHPLYDKVYPCEAEDMFSGHRLGCLKTRLNHTRDACVTFQSLSDAVKKVTDHVGSYEEGFIIYDLPFLPILLRTAAVCTKDVDDYCFDEVQENLTAELEDFDIMEGYTSYLCYEDEFYFSVCDLAYHYRALYQYVRQQEPQRLGIHRDVTIMFLSFLHVFHHQFPCINGRSWVAPILPRVWKRMVNKELLQ